MFIIVKKKVRDFDMKFNETYVRIFFLKENAITRKSVNLKKTLIVRWNFALSKLTSILVEVQSYKLSVTELRLDTIYE